VQFIGFKLGETAGQPSYGTVHLASTGAQLCGLGN
jgi:hypothetical protein